MSRVFDDVVGKASIVRGPDYDSLVKSYQSRNHHTKLVVRFTLEILVSGTIYRNVQMSAVVAELSSESLDQGAFTLVLQPVYPVKKRPVASCSGSYNPRSGIGILNMVFS